jgi:hypothetical protein
MGGLDVIMTWDFYQVLPIWDSWISNHKLMDWIAYVHFFGMKTSNVTN